MKKHFLIFLVLLVYIANMTSSVAQDSAFILKAENLNNEGFIKLDTLTTWKFQEGNDPAWASMDFDDSAWRNEKILGQGNNILPGSGRVEGWFRLTFYVDESLLTENLYLRIATMGAARAYINGVEIMAEGNPSLDADSYKRGNGFLLPTVILNLEQENVLAIHYSELNEFLQKYTFMELNSGVLVNIGTKDYLESRINFWNWKLVESSFVLGAMALIFLLFFILNLLNKQDHLLFWIFVFVACWSAFLINAYLNYYGINLRPIPALMLSSIGLGAIFMFPLLISKMILPRTRRLFYYFPPFIILFYIIAVYFSRIPISGKVTGPILYLSFVALLIVVFFIIFKNRDRITKPFKAINAGIILTIVWFLIFFSLQLSEITLSLWFENLASIIVYLIFPLSLLVFVALRSKEHLLELQRTHEQNAQLNEQKLVDEQEKKEILARQNQELELQVTERTQNLTTALDQLKSSQQQVIQQEKLASLGQLTAGIAHEIKNPLNFVNNFSDLNLELVKEIFEEVEKLEKSEITGEINLLLKDVEANLRKIFQHGTRADSIVKSMLQHSRGGSGKAEPTALNALVREYVNLSFHGMRAGKKPINVTLNIDLDENMGMVPLIGEDFSRVLLNLCNNAFDAMRDQTLSADFDTEYKPNLKVKTFRRENSFTLEIEDNGPGIPKDIQDKILQPFFTTKKGTEGTGLGLSITHDIITAHQGTLKIVSEEGQFTRFEIEIPILINVLN
ncbi:MAG: ATP-binding protein [Gillisia sp.]